MKKTLLLALFLFPAGIYASSQVYNPVKWEYKAEKINASEYELKFTASIDAGWHMYGLNIPPDGPVPTSITFNETRDIEFRTDIIPVESPEIKYDPTFEMNLELFSNKISFTRKVKVLMKGKHTLTGTIEFMACDDSKCLPPKEESFEFVLVSDKQAELQPLKENSEESASSKSIPVFETQKINVVEKDNPDDSLIISITETDKSSNESVPAEKKKKERSLLGLLLIGIVAGFGALITPCVYPIIPLTVSFFMRDTSRKQTISNGLLFGFSIVAIYTFVGLVVGVFRIDLVRLIASHWLPNVIFFLLFILLAFSFFGLFEITLPSSWSTRIDQRADKGGFLGPFFMALATVVISFSCTGLFAGAVLGTALQGEIIRPVIGMFGFSVAFALPFTLLAIFPGFISKLPKSGGWLNSVKVFFAFILLASSLMFLSNLRLGFFTRELALAILIVIFILLGIYLLGKIKFAHDSDLPYISIPRLLITIAVFVFAARLIPGLFGYPVNGVAPFIPEKSVYSNYFTKATITAQSSPVYPTTISNICTDKPKYSDLLELPHGLKGYFDYEEALACAKELGKPVLLDFAGHSCKNCKKMYAEVWADPRVFIKLQNDFVIAALYTDDRTRLDSAEWITSSLDGKVKNTIGKKFNDLQITKFGSNALPLYAIVDDKGNILTEKKYYTYSPNVENFIDFLDNGLKNYRRN